MGTLENFWSKASEMLWAGSVEMMRTLSLTAASCTAKLQLQVTKEQVGGAEEASQDSRGVVREQTFPKS